MARKQSGLTLFRTLFKDIRKQKQVKSVYYLYGDEMFLMNMIQDEIEKLIPNDQKDFNFDLIYGADSSPDSVLNIAQSYPMMAEKRVVIVRDFLKLDDNSDNGIVEFLEYFKNPNPHTILCLLDKKLPDGRREPGKYLKSSAAKEQIGLYQFSKVDEQLLPNWISDWAKHSHNMVITPQAAQILSQLVGQNLQVLSTEIEKLCTFVDTNEEITIDHVKKITESYREYNVIELKEAIFERDVEKALHISERMLLNSNNSTGEIIKTVGFFYSVFSNIWQICRLTEKGLNREQVQKELGLERSYAFKYQYKDAQRFRFSEMPRIFESLLDADRASKGFSTLDNSTIFLLLIKRIIG